MNILCVLVQPPHHLPSCVSARGWRQPTGACVQGVCFQPRGGRSCCWHATVRQCVFGVCRGDGRPPAPRGSGRSWANLQVRRLIGCMYCTYGTSTVCTWVGWRAGVNMRQRAPHLQSRAREIPCHICVHTVSACAGRGRPTRGHTPPSAFPIRCSPLREPANPPGSAWHEGIGERNVGHAPRRLAMAHQLAAAASRPTSTGHTH